jgi:hypothetical protein
LSLQRLAGPIYRNIATDWRHKKIWYIDGDEILEVLDKEPNAQEMELVLLQLICVAQNVQVMKQWEVSSGFKF